MEASTDEVYYAGELVPSPVQKWTEAEKLALLDWHPMFTGRCPRCETPIPFGERSFWQCNHCGWKNGSEMPV